MNPGSWTSPYGDDITINYYWSRCDANGNACEYLHTGRNHTLEPQDIRHVLRVMLSVETDHGVAITQVQSAVVRQAPPVNGVAPWLAGDPGVSERLTVNPGSWTSPYGDKVTVNSYWSRCDANGNALPVPAHRPESHAGHRRHRPRAARDAVGRDRPRRGHHVRAVGARAHGAAGQHDRAVAQRDAEAGLEADREPGHLDEPVSGGITFNYYWSRCDATGNGCAYLHTGSTHTLGRDDVGHVMRVMLSVETSHGVAITYVQSAVVS